MTLTMFAVYDSKARCYCAPFFCTNQGVALRAFASASNDKSLQLGRNPEDFTLFELGTFFDDLGTLEMHPQQVNLGLAANFVQRHIQDEIAS